MMSAPAATGAPATDTVMLRCLGALLTSLIGTLLLGKILIPWLRRREVLEQVQKTDSQVLAEQNEVKRGTPTMGGVLFVPPMVVATAMFARLDVACIPITLALVVGLALLGFRDDRIKLFSRKRNGLDKRSKFRVQIAMSAAAAVGLWLVARGQGPEAMELSVPFVDSTVIDLALFGGIPFLLFAMFVLTGSSNAVNLADGLDGLAAGCVMIAFVPLAVLAYVAGCPDLSVHCSQAFVPGASEMAVFAAATVGGCIGFLWFNCYPARIFMGDTGALALGGALGMTALSIKQELLLGVIGGIFVLETVSVILQVFSFQVFGRRIFRIAPIHHHFQFGGCPEWTVTTRFWLGGAALATVSLLTLAIQ